jgi:two-component system, response regulator PdtaR
MLVLVVDNESLGALRLTESLEDAGHTVLGPARSSGEGIILARRWRPKAAFVAIDLEAEQAGALLAQQLKQEFDIPVILTSDHARMASDVHHAEGSVEAEGLAPPQSQGSRHTLHSG